MAAPGPTYDAGTIAQMQSAIAALARRVAVLENKPDPVAQTVQPVKQRVVVGASIRVGEGTPEAVRASRGVAGKSGRYADSKHAHEGQPYQDLTKAEPEGGYREGTFAHKNGQEYCLLGGDKVPVTHFA